MGVKNDSTSFPLSYQVRQLVALSIYHPVTNPSRDLGGPQHQVAAHTAALLLELAMARNGVFAATGDFVLLYLSTCWG